MKKILLLIALALNITGCATNNGEIGSFFGTVIGAGVSIVTLDPSYMVKGNDMGRIVGTGVDVAGKAETAYALSKKREQIQTKK